MKYDYSLIAKELKAQRHQMRIELIKYAFGWAFIFGLVAVWVYGLFYLN